MSEITLNRFFALHVVALPIMLIMLVFLHIVALHHVGSNNPDGIDVKKHKDENGKPLDSIAFHPFYTIGHDLPAIVLFLIVFCSVVFFAPEMGVSHFFEPPNFEQAEPPLKTPDHIAPVWYYTPFYAMLRAATYPLFGMDAKFWGFVVMVGPLPYRRSCWLDRSPVKSIRYKGLISRPCWLCSSCLFPPRVARYASRQPSYTLLAQVGTAGYFAYFVLMPWLPRVERTKPVPGKGACLMKRFLIILGFSALLTPAALAADSGVHLEPMTPDHRDLPSLQQGAKLFMNYCLGCHSLEHQRHVRTAEDLGIPTDLYQASLLPAGADMGSHITNAMPAAGG